MARTKRTRRRMRRTGKWSSNIQELNNVLIATDPGQWSATTTLATNPTQNVLGVSNIYTVKNFDINFTIESGNALADANVLEAITAYIMFVPQGMNVDENYNLNHPEYILNYKYLGSPPGTSAAGSEIQQFQPFRLRTRLSRKLQTGDSIILYLKGTNSSSANVNVFLSGLIRWWTKAN